MKQLNNIIQYIPIMHFSKPINQPTLFLQTLAQQLQSASHQSLLFTDHKSIQSSIGIIFRVASSDPNLNLEDLLSLNGDLQEVEVLLTQRAAYEKDINANYIVFPGGQADPGQNDFQACKRELMEEINLNVDEQCFYLGKLPRTFYYLQKRKKSLYINGHVWVLRVGSSFKPQLNQDQLVDCRWVPLSQMLDLQNYHCFCQNGSKFLRGFSVGLIKENIHKFEVQFGSLDVGMRAHLWGVSLWVWHYLMGMVMCGLSKDANKNGFFFKKLTKLNTHIQQLSLRGNVPKPLLILSKFALKIWYIKRRKVPFSYGGSGGYLWVIGLLVVLVLLWVMINLDR